MTLIERVLEPSNVLASSALLAINAFISLVLSIHFIGSKTSLRPLNCLTIDIDGRASLLIRDDRPPDGC